jgi:hypothetical protein
MENKEWDDQMRDLVGDFKASDDQPMPDHHEPADPEMGWKRIEASLDAADQAFDETIRHRVHHYHPPYDPHTWPVFIKRFTNRKFLRAKLIALKSIEVAALLLLLFTVINLGRVGKLHIDHELFTPNRESREHREHIMRNQIEDKPGTTQPLKQAEKKTEVFAVADPVSASGFSKANSSNGSVSLLKSESVLLNNLASDSEIKLTTVTPSIPTFTSRSITTQGPDNSSASLPAPATAKARKGHSTSLLAMATPHLMISRLASIPTPQRAKQRNRTYTEFGVIVQSDYNSLRMPEDRLYIFGKQVVFPQKGIMSLGFGQGFTMALAHPKWALETGVIYSAKTFSPGRNLIVGGAFDNVKVEFEAMRMQVISVPLQYRYRFDQSGRFKAYALAGLGFHVIAHSNTDVELEYHFASLALGQNPKSVPELEETISESHRITEHIKDGAPLSSKSLVTANAGLGLEYSITPHKKLFLQSAVQYQIPGVEFSNNSGKHLQSVSLQAGIRTSLGK